MPVDRPTFSESWYRIAELTPRLRPTVQVHRQHFRGQMWHVLQDPASNQFFRLSEAAYYFIALLDGDRPVAEAWRIANDELGDEAPTQGEAIQLLGQLYTSNLLQAQLPPDAEGLFSRYRKRIQREVQGYLMNMLFMRFPLFDPDRFLNRWVGVFGKVFTWFGFVIWLALLATAGFFLAGHTDELIGSAEGILSVDSLPLLYAAFALIKVFHEFGHAFACKRFGRLEGNTGEVHTMGIMLLVLVPMPYVDASNAWSFRSKWRRVMVGAAGMYVELAVAAIAAIVWVHSSGSPMLQALTYRVMFIASVSTLLFNGNPLLRYDAYYILSDVVEIPNLSQRSKHYIYYLVRKYVWGVRQARCPAHNAGEKAWFLPYGLASTAYRVLICTAILWRVASNENLFIAGVALAIGAFVTWVIVPLGKFLHYLANSPELARVRGRAWITTGVFTVGILIAVGAIPWDDTFKIDGVAEPLNSRVVHARETGFLVSFCPDGTDVVAGETVLFRLRNRELESELEILRAQRDKLLQEQQLARRERGIEAAQLKQPEIDAKSERIRFIEGRLSDLVVVAPISGRWVAPNIEQNTDGLLERGQQVGMIADLDAMTIHAVVDQDVPLAEASDRVEVRVSGRPDLLFAGTISDRDPAGTRILPSPSLGVLGGGSIQTQKEDEKGLRTEENIFRIRITPQAAHPQLLPKQDVVVRLELSPKPIALQAYRSVLQLVQKRFGAG